MQIQFDKTFYFLKEIPIRLILSHLIRFLLGILSFEEKKARGSKHLKGFNLNSSVNTFKTQFAGHKMSINLYVFEPQNRSNFNHY